MCFTCTLCAKVYSRRDSLKRHCKRAHSGGVDTSLGKLSDVVSTHSNINDANYAFEREKINSKIGGLKTESVREKMNQNVTDNFKFKHPFCMMICAPSRSGKTYWVAKLLEKRVDVIDREIQSILYCYAHEQPLYDKIKVCVPGIQFQSRLPSTEEIDKMHDALIVIDDLMNEAVNDASLLSAFTEGSHHRNISVVILMQNLFHKGMYSRTMSINTQYLVLFKNPRDQNQIEILARQIFGRESSEFLRHFHKQTEQTFSSVVLDLHPTTPKSHRIVHLFDSNPCQITHNAVKDEYFYQSINTQLPPQLENRTASEESIGVEIKRILETSVVSTLDVILNRITRDDEKNKELECASHLFRESIEATQNIFLHAVKEISSQNKVLQKTIQELVNYRDIEDGFEKSTKLMVREKEPALKYQRDTNHTYEESTSHMDRKRQLPIEWENM